MKTTQINSADLTYTSYHTSKEYFSSGNRIVFNLISRENILYQLNSCSNSTINKLALSAILGFIKKDEPKTLQAKISELIKVANKYLALETKGVEEFTFQDSQDGVPTKKEEPFLNSLIAQLLRRTEINVEERNKILALLLQLKGAKDAINQVNTLGQTIADALLNIEITESLQHPLLVTLSNKFQELKIPLQFKRDFGTQLKVTPLHLAVKHNIPILFNAAIEQRGWINQPGTDGLTAGEWLAITNNRNTYLYLVALYNKGAKLERALAIVGPQVFLHFAHSRHAGDDAPFLQKLAQYHQPIYQKYLEQVELGGFLLAILKDDTAKPTMTVALAEIVKQHSQFAARIYAYIQSLPDDLRDNIIKTVTTQGHPMLAVWKQDNHLAKLQIELKRIFKAISETESKEKLQAKSIIEQLETHISTQKLTIDKEIAAILELSATSVSKTTTTAGSTPILPEKKARAFITQEEQIIQQDIKALSTFKDPTQLSPHKFAFSILGETLTLALARSIRTSHPDLIQLITILEKHDTTWQTQNFPALYQAIAAGTFTHEALQQMARVLQFKTRLLAYINTLEPRQTYTILKKSTEDQQDPIHIIWATARTKKRETNINRGNYRVVYLRVQELEKQLLGEEKQQLLQLLATAQGMLGNAKGIKISPAVLTGQVFTKILTSTQLPSCNPESLEGSTSKDDIQIADTDTPIVAIAIDLITNPKSLPHRQFDAVIKEEKLSSETNPMWQKLHSQFTLQAQKFAGYLYSALEIGDEKNVFRLYNKIALCNRCKSFIQASTSSSLYYDLQTLKQTLKIEYGEDIFKSVSWKDDSLEQLVDTLIKTCIGQTTETPSSYRFSVWNKETQPSLTSSPISSIGTSTQSTTLSSSSR